MRGRASRESGVAICAATLSSPCVDGHLPEHSADFRVGEGPPAVQIAQEGPSSVGPRSTAVPGVGVRRQRTCFLITNQFQRHEMRNSPVVFSTLGTSSRKKPCDTSGVPCDLPGSASIPVRFGLNLFMPLLSCVSVICMFLRRCP